jgi:hypothetical protein
MADAQPGTLETVVHGLAALLAPYGQDADPADVRALLSDFGLTFPVTVETDAALTSALNGMSQNLGAMPPLVDAIIAAEQTSDVTTMVSKALDLAHAITGVIAAIEAFTAAVKNLAARGITAGELATFADGLLQAMLDAAVVRALEPMAGVVEALEFVGAIERTEVAAVDATHPAYIRRRFDPTAFMTFVQNPLGVLGTKYGWGQPGFTGVVLLQELAQLATGLGMPAVLDTTGPTPVLDLIFVEISPRTDLSPAALAFTITAKAAISEQLPVSSSVTITAGADFEAGTAIVFASDDSITVTPPTGTVQGEFSVAWVGSNTDGTPFLLLGEAGASFVQAQQFSARAGVTLGWDLAKNQATGAFAVAATLTGGTFVVDLGSADGFLSTIFGGQGLQSEFALQLGYSTKQGVYFEGSATLDIQLPLHVSLGPIDLTALTLGIGLGQDALPISLAADISAALGPLQAAVQELGFTLNVTLPADHHGNAGPVDVSLAFKPPKGVALSIDAGIVTGGGYLYIDSDRGEYAGALQLMFADFVALSAIGLISTKNPDGSPGFSLLVLITADFGSGIQLGFGFTLNAVGGLLGVNRGMLFQPIMDGVRTGAIESVMFPKDVIATAPRIISDLKAFFPPQQGTFLIGPMAELGWGEPSLITLSLGVIIEIPPGDIAILGILHMALPADDVAVLVLQVNFAGALEFSKQRLYFFASLFDSHILFITIDGDMGLLFAWGSDANFVVSIGGFHPQFTPPPLPFPTPRRIAIDIINESFARIHADGYFAVTSNSVQFGTSAQYFFGFSALSVSGHSSFDALIEFSPFHFSVSISTSFSVQVFGLGVYGIDIDLTLDGPTPWHAHGTASLSFFFFSVSIGIDFTWGGSQDTTLPPVQVMPIVAAEYAKQSNWRAVLPTGSNLMVTLRALDPSESQFVLHPVGTLQVSQRAVPIDLTLDKVGNCAPSDANHFGLSVTSTGLQKSRTLQEPSRRRSSPTSMTRGDSRSRRTFPWTAALNCRRSAASTRRAPRSCASSAMT